MSEETNPAELASMLEAAKIAETAARNHRIEIEERIIEALGAKAEGSETHDVGNYKLTITGKLTRSIDWDALDDLVPPGWQPVRWKRELDAKKLKSLKSASPNVFQLVEECMTTKPAKTAVTIKRKDA